MRLARRAVLALVAALAMSVPGSAAAQPSGLSYNFGYSLRLETARTPESLTTAVTAELARFFPFKSNCPVLPSVGGKCDLYAIPNVAMWGAVNPVQVTERTATGWTFRTLPGHGEGSDRTITFSFDWLGSTPTMQVRGEGPYSQEVANAVFSGTAFQVWQRLADNVSAAF
ncbi:hypothetical protein [Actinokineospora iranica]|uniref:Polyketide cyclase / dehydrase and lipid transport n=1 Tax=Actinokineospora iranica TaxID=1271860 RepID=A0A1G6VGC0_9PSEU|nr:hypothetical protein [Actinokineospora iranica]SDD52619.1 hypothetical protein SAMN05216174_112128 [Actinokineospora iranica]